MIRDGRDVALSLSKMGGFKPFFWDRETKGLLPTAVYWEWMVHKGRHDGLRIPADYLEVRYEELVSDPRTTLRKVEEFLDHDLDYKRIRNTSLGRLRESNSSFPEESIQHSPVNRWREKLSSPEVDAIEKVVGAYLEESGYPLSSRQATRKPGLREKFTRSFYFNLLNTKLWLKTRTPAGRLANLKLWNCQTPSNQRKRNERRRGRADFRGRCAGYAFANCGCEAGRRGAQKNFAVLRITALEPTCELNPAQNRRLQ